MATKTTESRDSTSGFSANFTQGVIDRAEAIAYKMIYDEGLLPKLVKPIAQGQKGSAVVWPYFDPSTFATAASLLTEGNDFVNYTQLTNASVIVVASELGVVSFLTDIVKEDAKVDIPSELGHQQGISCSVAMEKHILGALGSGFTTGTITGTNSTNGFTMAKYATCKAILDAKALTVPGRKHAVVPTYSWVYTSQGTWSTTYASVMGSKGEEVQSKYYIDTLFGDIDLYHHGTAYVTASSTAAGYMFATDAVGLWKPRDYRLEMQRDATARGTEAVSTFRAGAKVLVSGYGVRMKMYASTPS